MVKGKLRATLIQRFDGSTALIGLKSEGVEFSVKATLQEAHAEAEKLCRAITIGHLHGLTEGGHIPHSSDLRSHRRFLR